MSIYLMYFEALILDAQTFRTVMSFWWTGSFIIMKWIYLFLVVGFVLKSPLLNINKHILDAPD